MFPEAPRDPHTGRRISPETWSLIGRAAGPLPRKVRREADGLARPLDRAVDHIRGWAQATGVARPTGKHRAAVAR